MVRRLEETDRMQTMASGLNGGLGMSITLRDEIETAINRNCAENGSNTPDFILAEYLTDCLAVYDKAVCSREAWYGRGPAVCVEGTPNRPGAMIPRHGDA